MEDRPEKQPAPAHDPQQRHTDPMVLKLGIQYLVGTVLLMVLGPYLLTLSFLNDGKIRWIILIPAIVVCAGAVFMGFKAIGTVMRAVFGERRK